MIKRSHTLNTLFYKEQRRVKRGKISSKPFLKSAPPIIIPLEHCPGCVDNKG
jgi:hypothetical protein